MHKEREKTWSTNLKDQAEDTKRVIDMGVIGMIDINNRKKYEDEK